MNTLKTLIALFVLAVASFAQSSPAFTFTQGLDSVSARPCNDSSNVGSIYTQIAQGGVTSVCQKTGADSLGAGAFAWVTVIGGATVTTGGGSISVATGKTATFSNTLTFAGTDGTTMTFPTATSTLARSSGTNTFTGVQTFSSAPVLSTSTLTSGAGTITFPTSSLTVPGTVISNCGTTSTCAGTNVSASSKVVSGAAPLVSGSPSAVTITGISPAFTSTTSYACSVTNQTSAADSALKVVNTSSSSITITGPNTVTDVVTYVCVGS